MTRFERYFHKNYGVVKEERLSIMKALTKKPSTATELVEIVNIPKEQLIWNLLGLLKWGDIEVTDEIDHELVYAAKEGNQWESQCQ